MVEMVTVAMEDKVADKEVDKVMNATSTNAHPAKWTIIPPKHAERNSPLTGIQTPPVMMSGHATTAVSQDNSKQTAYTSNVPMINPTRYTKAQHFAHLQQQEIAI
jgi:hypothetical protein